METFRVRLNCVDHYQAAPTSHDPNVPILRGVRNGSIRSKLPVIRIFGSTETGQKVCAHVHGALPYLYIKYLGNPNPNEVMHYIHQIHLSIDHALMISYRRQQDGENAKFVAHISLIKGVPFYGFHVGYELFLKIYMLNPLNMTRLADLLRQGAIMSKPFQPYESHMQYLAQWMCDYNLYGCAFVEFRNAGFRLPLPAFEEAKSASHDWHDHSIHPDSVLDEAMYPRQSHCSIEIDVNVEHILNRLEIKPRPIHHDFVDVDRVQSQAAKLVQSMAGLWRDETIRRKKRMGLEDPSSSPFPAEVLVSVSADPRNAQAAGWIHEEDFRQSIAATIKDERQNGDGQPIGYDNFVAKPSFDQSVKTALESVEDLFHDNLRAITKAHHSTQTAVLNGPADSLKIPQVDESRVVLSEDDENSAPSSDVEAFPPVDAAKSSFGRNNTTILRRAAAGSRDGHLELQQTNVIPSDTPSTAAAASKSSEQTLTAAQLLVMGVQKSDTSIRKGAWPKLAIGYVSNVTAERKAIEKAEQERVRKRRKRFHTNHYEHDLGTTIQSPGSETNPASLVSSSPVLDLQTSQNGNLTQPTLHQQETPNEIADQTGAVGSGGRQGHLNTAVDPADYKSTKVLQSPSHLQAVNTKDVKDSGSSHTASKSCQQEPSMRKSSSTIEGNLVSHSQRVIGTKQPRSKFTPGNRPSLLVYDEFAIPSSMVTADLRAWNCPSIVHRDPFYSRDKDVPDRAREYAGKEFKLEGNSVQYLPLFNPTCYPASGHRLDPVGNIDKQGRGRLLAQKRLTCNLRTWEINKEPPSRRDVLQWVLDAAAQEASEIATSKPVLVKSHISQIDSTTPKNKNGFKFPARQKSTSVMYETQYMSIMSLEIHVNTRDTMVPNPEKDEIGCIFWSLKTDGRSTDDTGPSGADVGIIVLSDSDGLAQTIRQQTCLGVDEESTELEVINRLVDVVRRLDPDILTGYEVHGNSWGYLIERARSQYDYNLCDEISRVITDSHGRFGKEEDRWGFNHTSTIRVTGRHMINIWRAMRGELNLLQYTMENVVFQLCHRRIPHYSFADLTLWYRSGRPRDIAKVLDYFISRVRLDIEILEQNELVPRTSEQARLLGVDFFSVFSRGSQFKVESLMFRIAKPENFILPSPSRKQVGQQNALECLPLVMEPQSAFYPGPLLVLDFQSLYPSVMIAYNYCYSTCLGRVVNWRGQNKMGFTDYHRQPRLLELLQEHINVAPNGMMYARPEIRRSLLAKMLGEILETRVMVKSGMKVDKDDSVLQRLLNNRQLALKLIANVTYGYTSASFSGRMPCSEIADSIVQTGRETLEKAIALIHSVEKWAADVVYGDTDSLFVYLKGRTKQQAFEIGQDIAQTVTKMNPRPIKLKFEKVYYPCVLLAKKRYVGFKYESKDQLQPDFDAKGIETIRRDGTPAVQKIEEAALKLLFRTADLSQVKRHFQKQCEKIMRGQVSIQDFCFAKEVKLGTYSDRGPPPPGALISTRKMVEDPRAEPQYGERVPYVVIAGGPGARLIDRCVDPEVVLHDANVDLDAEYYISKHLIPPLERIFNLMGANVRQWYEEMQKFQRVRLVDTPMVTTGKESMITKKTLESYMKSSSCQICRVKLDTETGICEACENEPWKSFAVIENRLGKDENRSTRLENICRSCANVAWGDTVMCDSKDCPVYYSRIRQSTRVKTRSAVLSSVKLLLGQSAHGDLEW